MHRDRCNDVKEETIRDETGMCKDCSKTYYKRIICCRDLNSMPKVCPNCGGTMLVSGECKRC